MFFGLMFVGAAFAVADPGDGGLQLDVYMVLTTT